MPDTIEACTEELHAIVQMANKKRIPADPDAVAEFHLLASAAKAEIYAGSVQRATAALAELRLFVKSHHALAVSDLRRTHLSRRSVARQRMAEVKGWALGPPAPLEDLRGGVFPISTASEARHAAYSLVHHSRDKAIPADLREDMENRFERIEAAIAASDIGAARTELTELADLIWNCEDPFRTRKEAQAWLRSLRSRE